VTVAFERLNVDLQISPTIGQVEMELDKLALAAKLRCRFMGFSR